MEQRRREDEKAKIISKKQYKAMLQSEFRNEFEDQTLYDRQTGLPLQFYREEIGNKEIKWTEDLREVSQNASYQYVDKLIHGLGYLDYRDFLAANKYVMEAKKSTDSY